PGPAHRFDWLSCFLASSTMRSALKPNFFCSSFSGADAPKVLMPRTLPVRPTYWCQPNVEAISTATRAVTDDGMTDSRSDGSLAQWCSNISHDGMLTTRALTPSAFSFS